MPDRDRITLDYLEALFVASDSLAFSDDAATLLRAIAALRACDPAHPMLAALQEKLAGLPRIIRRPPRAALH